MAPAPQLEQSKHAAAGESQKSAPTPFLTKTYQLVDDQAADDVISWNGDGSGFVVWNITVFARDLLPKYFKHNNFSSFVRQLNTYGFKKVAPERWEFSHDCFRRGEKQLLLEIQRRKVPTSPAAAPPQIVTAVQISNPIKSPSSSGDDQMISSSYSLPSARGQSCPAELMDENERLRKENMILSKELTQMKSLCSSIFSLMSSYANGQPISRRQSSPPEFIHREFRPSEQPRSRRSQFSGEADESPRLFGVPIGGKRTREDHGLRIHRQEKTEVKSEAPPDQDLEPWLSFSQWSRANQKVCN